MKSPNSAKALRSKLRKSLNRSRRVAGALASESRWRSPSFELLEERRLLSVAQDLVSQLTAYQPALSAALHAAPSLPLSGDDLQNLPEFNAIFQNSLSRIESQTQGLGNGHHQLSIPLTPLAKTFAFDLGLDAFLQIHTAGSVQAAINPVLTVGFDVINGTASLSPLQTNLDIGFQLTLPGFQGTMSLNSLLFVQATDVGSDFQGHLQFNLAAGAGVTPHFSGEAHVNLGLSLSFVDPALDPSFNPTFRTTLDLDWAINTANNQMLAPTVSLVNFGLDVESFMDGLLGDIVETVQKFTKPIQPFVDIFQTPVPIISAFGSDETIGSILLKGAGSSEAQQTSFTLMMQIIDAVNAIDLSGDSGGAVIPFGTVTLVGDARTAGAFSFSAGAMGNAIDDVFNSPALQGVEDALQSLGDYADMASSSGFKFPLLEDPGRVIVGMLSGNVETMFSFSTGRQHFELAPSIGVGIPGILGVFLSAGVVFDANLTMGYDTAGLIAYAADPSRPEHLLHGFYFDNSIDTSVPTSSTQPPIRHTGLYLHGQMELQGDILLGHVTGGLYADVSVELANPSALPHVYLDDIVTNLGAGSKVFKLSGKVYASADISVELPIPFGPDITLFEMNLAYAELLNFDPPLPPAASPPPVIHSIATEHTALLDASKMGGGSKVVTVQPFHNLAITNDGPVYFADGIRVDYHGETHLYVERKDDSYFNYFNLIAIEGTAPDGVTINVIDPFDVFVDEGAPNPYPAQTKPTIMLVGGKNVYYKYSEEADGTYANVFLAGGYGHNTLIGGTMEFGNFIPSSRVAQAHAYFANRSGFDGVGQSQINAQIANAVASSTQEGIIGATLYASRGGLMMGGPGNNSFYATGAGVYEMVGGNWINTFNVSPSFNGAPATYEIDGGGGASGLVVRVPSYETVTFEGSTIVDKYNPAYKALAVKANAGLSATAHGLSRVHIVAQAGSNVELGDTSEVNVQFSISGSAHLKLVGSSAPDVFDVASQGSFFAKENHEGVKNLLSPGQLPQPDWVLERFPYLSSDGLFYVGATNFPRFADPVLTVTRTFGTNGKTEIMPFAIRDANASSITLDGKGSSDPYHIAVGQGFFIDITVEDSDAATRNPLDVDLRNAYLLPHKATLTDESLKLEYFTGLRTYHVYYGPSSGPEEYYASWASVPYSPTVFFNGNTDLTFKSYLPFQQTVINRPTAPQSVAIVIDGAYVLPPYEGYGDSTAWAYDPDSPSPALFQLDSTGYVEVLANGGNLSIANAAYNTTHRTTFDVRSNAGALSIVGTSAFFGEIDVVNVFGNAGTINIDHTIVDAPYSQGYVPGLYHTVNVRANAGTINLHDSAASHLIAYFADAQVNLGDNGSLANVRGVINFSNSNSRYGLRIDDSQGSPSRTWSIGAGQAQIGELLLKYAGVNAPAPYADIFSKFEAYPKVGSSVTLASDPPFYHRQFNGTAFPAWQVVAPYALFHQDGNAVSESLSISGDPGGPVSYSATNLPPGLAINAATGIISGTISALAYRTDPYETTVTATAGVLSRSRSIAWYVGSAIELSPAIFGIPLGHEGMAASLGPLTTTNAFNRPVTLSVTGLPPGLVFHPATATVDGVIDVGAAQNGPYPFTIHATDGIETAEFVFAWQVTGIAFATPAIRANRIGDSVVVPIEATTASGAAVTYNAENLPGGLAMDPATGLITGAVAAPMFPVQSYFVTVTATQGSDVASRSFYWSVVLPGLASEVVLVGPGDQTHRAGDSPYVSFYATSSLGLPVAYTVQGLPPGIFSSLSEGGGLLGQIAAGAAANSPYHVVLTASDGIWSDQVTFDWIVQSAGTVDVSNPGIQYALVGDAVNLPIYATSSLSQPLIYSAAGLPDGLSIDPQTGVITGAISPLASLPSVFQASVNVTDGTSSSATTFLWNVWSGYESNVISLPRLNGQGFFSVISPIGTQLSASISSTAGVAAPAWASFPFGFVTFVIRGLSPGAAADLTIVGLDTAAITDYYKYGATPANPANHWYDFLFGQQTDGDSAVGTGMEIVGDAVVLHLIDGGRGDDDVALNGVIFDIGGPAISLPTIIPGDYDRDGHVDGSDFLLWQRQLGSAAIPVGSGADGNSSGAVDGPDLTVWATNFGESAMAVNVAAANVSLSLSSPLEYSLPSATAMFSRNMIVGLQADAATFPSRLSRDSAFDFVGRHESEIVAGRLIKARTKRLELRDDAVTLYSARTVVEPKDFLRGSDAVWSDEGR